MDGLHIALKSMLDKSLISGVKLPSNGPRIYHPFYADDVIFVGEWDMFTSEISQQFSNAFTSRLD